MGADSDVAKQWCLCLHPLPQFDACGPHPRDRSAKLPFPCCDEPSGCIRRAVCKRGRSYSLSFIMAVRSDHLTTLIASCEGFQVRIKSLPSLTASLSSTALLSNCITPHHLIILLQFKLLPLFFQLLLLFFLPMVLLLFIWRRL